MFFTKRSLADFDQNEAKMDDLVLESLSSDDEENPVAKIKPNTLNQKDRIILVPLKPSENVKLSEEQIKMIKDQELFEQMVKCINNGENKLPKPTLKDECEVEEVIQFDSSELLLEDDKEDKIYKLDKIKYERDEKDENESEANEKYR